MFENSSVGEVFGNFKMNTQSCEIVTDYIVKLIGDARALADATAFCEQLSRGSQFCIRPCQLVASERLAPGDRSGDESEQLKRKRSISGEQSQPGVESCIQDGRENGRLYEYPQERHAHR